MLTLGVGDLSNLAFLCFTAFCVFSFASGQEISAAEGLRVSNDVANVSAASLLQSTEVFQENVNEYGQGKN